MRIKNVLSAAALAVIALFSSQNLYAAKKLTQYVNPFIGTGGHGHVFLGANVPFGLVQLGPTQVTQGWDWCSGYHYSDSVLIGFGHMHLSGTGIGDLGDIALLPIAQKDQRKVKFSHENETAKAGYYTLKLSNPDVKVELTATQRVGMHRYTFNGGGDKALLLLDLAQGIGWDAMSDYLMTQESETRITGFRRSKGWANDQRIYFSMDFSEPVTVVEKDLRGRAILSVQNGGTVKPLLVKVALSPVDIDKAKVNMAAELPGWDFDATAKAADEAWEENLSRVEIGGTTEARKQTFYTAMYHLMTAPSVFCDVDGEYRGADKNLYKGNFTNYTTFSLWDTYRAAFPLMTILFPEKQKDFALTFMNICDQQGDLPVWHLMGNETDCMVGNPGAIILADLVLKGFVDDKQRAFDALKKTQMADDRSLDLMKEYGYIPYDKETNNESVAKALEYFIADNGVAKVAKLLGKTDDYNYFSTRAKNYTKYFDKRVEFMRGISSDGVWRTPFNPFKSVHRVNDYTEGTAWQYTWLVPHDVHGLVDLFGSEKAFTTKFDSLFVVSGDMGAEASPDISGLTGQYAHGNEPGHHTIYLYNYIGQPWKAAKLLRKQMNEQYHNAPDGLCGNEDVGQMSAWYIISTLGMYQVDPSGGNLIIGTPLFGSAKINVGDGKTFSVIARNNSDKNIYVQKAKLNGRTLTKSYISYEDVMKGGTLELTMGSKPSKWGTKAADRP